MAARSSMFTITRADQQRVVASPVRQELLDVLARMGDVSLAQLGAVLGRPADGLYYHVRLLVRAGLVEKIAGRGHNGRTEARFRAVARQFALRYGDSAAARERAVGSVVRAMLRLGIRDFRRALRDDTNAFEGAERDLWALRTTGWLSRADVRRVNAMILRLSRSASRSAPDGRLYAVTVLLAPLDYRSNRTGRRPRLKSRR